MSLNNPEPAPAPNAGEPCWPLVIKDMEERHVHGVKKYGTPLCVGDGRKALVDAYQESLDMAVYLRKAIAEDNDRQARFEIAVTEMRREGYGLTLSQEQRLRRALGW